MDNKNSVSMSRRQKVTVGILLLIALFAFYLSLDANKYSATVLVIEESGKLGVNPTTEALDFGDLSPGASAIRRIDIENGIRLPVYVAVMRLGSITDIMSLNNNFFRVPGKSSDKIEFTVYMPASAPVGERLSGRVFLFKIPMPF